MTRRSGMTAALRVRVAASVLLASVGLIASACGGVSAAAKHAPTIQVVTGLFPLAQAVEQIGQSKVTVTDVVPTGDDPTTYELTAAQVTQVHHAAVVVQVGDGFQPSLQAATTASGAQVVVNLQSELGASDPYVWLDPSVMGRAVNLIAAALERANPQAASLYRNGAEAFGDEVTSTGIDYENTLSACTRKMIVTPDDAFEAAASQYGLTDVVVGTASDPDEATVTTTARRLINAGLTTMFDEPFANDGTITALSRATALKVRVLDTLTGPQSPPGAPGGWPSHANYLSLMEANLGTLNNALGCPNAETGQ